MDKVQFYVANNKRAIIYFSYGNDDLKMKTFSTSHNILNHGRSNPFITPAPGMLFIRYGHGTGILTITGYGTNIAWKFLESLAPVNDSIDLAFYLPKDIDLYASFNTTLSTETIAAFRY